MNVKSFFRKDLNGMEQRAGESERIQEAVKYFISTDEVSIENNSVGSMNRTRFLTTLNNKFVLKISGKQRTDKQLQFEYELLQKLQKHIFSFSLQCYANYKSQLQLSDQSWASLYVYIPGKKPDIHNPLHIREMGKASGELTIALENVRVDIDSPMVPSWDLYHLHPQITKESLRNFLQNPLFGLDRSKLDRFRTELYRLEAELDRLQSLPMQIIHRDLFLENVLVDDHGKVSGVVDFEYASLDARAADLGAALGQFIDSYDHEASLSRIQAYLEGYGAYVEMTDTEIDLIPMFMRLKSANCFIFDLGCVQSGFMDIDTLQSDLDRFVWVTEWLESFQDECIFLCQSYLSKQLPLIDSMPFEEQTQY